PNSGRLRTLAPNSGRDRTLLRHGSVRSRPLFGSETAASACTVPYMSPAGGSNLICSRFSTRIRPQETFADADSRGGRHSRRQTLAEAGSRRLAHAAADSLPRPPDSGSEQLTDVRPGEVDELVALAREHSADGVEGEARGLLDGDLRRHRELLTFGDHIEDGGTVIGEELLHHLRQVLGLLDAEALDADRLGDRGEVGVGEVGAEG